MHFQGDPTDKEKVMLGQVIKKSINPLPFEKRTGQRKEYYSSWRLEMDSKDKRITLEGENNEEINHF